MTQEEALKWIEALFEQPPGSFTPKTLREDIPNWDSLGVLTLMAELDEKHGILLPDTELRAMTRVDDILEALRKAGKLT